MLGWFGNKKSISVKVDIHSHLIPGIDDGVKSIEESVQILAGLEKIGYQKVITTPHIHSDYYPNTKESIIDGLSAVKEAIATSGLKIELDAAAEYFIDSDFLRTIEDGEKLLSFGKPNYVLIETPFMNRPLIFDEVVFKLKSNDYTPILAHPERYTYLSGDLFWLKKVKKQGVNLQITTTSLVGAYGREAQKVANQLLKEGMVDFIGSDLHRLSQLPIFEKSVKQKIIPQLLKNNELI